MDEFEKQQLIDMYRQILIETEEAVWDDEYLREVHSEEVKRIKEKIRRLSGDMQ